MIPHSSARRVAIACGGTGGHLFPGLAVARELSSRGIEVLLFVSPKEVDQRALRGSSSGFRVETLPAVGLSGRNLPAFLSAVWRGHRQAQATFRTWRPDAVLAMGGFTSVAPILAGRRSGARCYLHESNAFPGRATRWLARMADGCFLGFSAAARHLVRGRVFVTGTPVRAEFRNQDPATARAVLGLDPLRPMLLVMGGSQGAHGVNQLVTMAIPSLASRHSTLQFCHLTGPSETEAVRSAYAAAGVPARVLPFTDRMDCMLASATLAVSRSGASSLAEMAAVRVPSILVPFPAATDDHQRLNAEAFVKAGAARMLDQRTANPEEMADAIASILEDDRLRESMRVALGTLDVPFAAARIADGIEEAWLSPGAGRVLSKGVADVVAAPAAESDSPLHGARTGVA